MALISSTKVCLMWYIIVQSGPQPPILGGAWNNDTTASPDDLTGGIPFNVGGCLTEPIYLMATGTGDANVNMNFGQGQFFGSLPNTYQVGWQNKFGGIDKFDAASVQGSATIDSSGFQVGFPTSAGAARSVTGIGIGRYYVEYTVTYDIFSQLTGAGPMRAGAQIPYAGDGGYSSTDPNGGAMVSGGNITTTPPYQPSVGALNVSGLKPSPLLGAPSQTVMGLAIAVIPQALFVPQPFVGIPLRNMRCCPATQNLARAMTPLSQRPRRPS
jgi:hypothetical protein